MAVLQYAVLKRRKYLIDYLLGHGGEISKLRELTLAELERMYIALRCQIGREMSQTRS